MWLSNSSALMVTKNINQLIVTLALYVRPQGMMDRYENILVLWIYRQIVGWNISKQQQVNMFQCIYCQTKEGNNFIIIVPADGLAPEGARPSAGTRLTT